MSVNQDLINEAKAALSVFGLGLFSTDIWVSEKYHPSLVGTLGGINIKFRHFPKSLSHLVLPEDTHERKLIRYLYETEAQVIKADAAGNDDQLFRVRSVFYAEYQIIAGSNPSEESLHEFARCNVGFQIWPYWREYFSSCLVRCGFPSMVLPMYDLKTAPKELVPTAASD